MIRESPNAIQREAEEARPHAEAIDQYIDFHQHEWHDDATRPMCCLWPTLMSLWRGN